MNTNNKSPNKDEVNIDTDQDDHLSKERAFADDEHNSVQAEEGLSKEKEVDHRPQSSDSASVVNVTEQSLMRKQLSFAIAKLFQNEDIILKAQGLNIGKAVRMAEIIKQRVEFLHQISDFQKSQCKQRYDFN